MQQVDRAKTGCINYAGETASHARLGSSQSGLKHLLRSKLALFTACTALILSGCGSSASAVLAALTVTNASIVEGNAGTTNLVFTVTSNIAATSAIAVVYATADGTATAGQDYTATNGTLNIAVGATSGTVSVPVSGDTVIEADETFTLVLTAPANATITGGTITGTITNDDFPTVSIANASVAEGSSLGTTNLDFTVTLSAASASAITVDYAASDGTALSASDYTPITGTLTIVVGATTGTITVIVGADTLTEADETLTLTLSNPAGATIATAAATGTITNDDWIYNSTAGIAMINAGFVYVPGGWDVNGDGSIESGFWLSKYQASATATPAVINANLIDYLAGTAGNGYADGMHVYNPVTKQFDQTLCIDGTDAGGATPVGCRGNNYIKAGKAAITVNRVQFVNSAVPLVNESAVEAMASIADSPIAGGVTISLPSELQWMQVTQLLINNPASWTDGVVNSGTGTLWRGNSNGTNALAANSSSATDTIENTTFDVNRRTWLLTNGVMANDSAVPVDYCAATNADASVDGSLESVNAATEAKCTVWDVAGNVWQWTRGLIAANAATSNTGVRAGGDRFIDGVSAWQEYSNATLQANAPAWWIPKLAGGTVLISAQNAGRYFDGGAQTGVWDTFDIGYGAGGNVSGFAAVYRGGGWRNSTLAGLGAADLGRGPGLRGSRVGFRSASL